MNKINKSFSNNNYIHLNTYDNRDNQFTLLNMGNNEKEKENEKDTNFLFTQNNINNYFILKTYDNKENYINKNNNNLNNKKDRYSFTKIHKRKINQNNLLNDFFNNNINNNYSSNNIFFNTKNNFKSKKNN